MSFGRNISIFLLALSLFATSAHAADPNCPYETFAGETTATARPSESSASAVPNTELEGSPYEKFNFRTPLSPGHVASLPDEHTAMTSLKFQVSVELRQFDLPQGNDAKIVIDSDSGELAIEIQGLSGEAAAKVAAKLSSNQAIHSAMANLLPHGYRRAKVHAPATKDGITVSFQTGGRPPVVTKKFANGKSYPEFQYEDGAQNTHAYKELSDNSVEVIYMPKGPWGHLAIRVGSKYYSYGMVGKYVSREFAPFPGAKGFGFKVPAEKIHEVNKAMEQVTANATKYNVPPYDVYAERLEVVRQPDGSLRYKSDTPESMKSGDAIIRNNEPVNAKIVKEGDLTFLETPDGFRYEVKIINGRMYVEPINCIGSVRQVLSRFGIDLGIEDRFPKTVTESVDRVLTPGNLGGTTPDFVVDYSRLRSGSEPDPHLPRAAPQAPPGSGRELLKEPVPLNSLYEIYSVSYPQGKANGALYYVRPKNHIGGLKALEGDKFVPARTDYSEAPELFTAMGFRAETDPRVGEYWTEIPSAELAQANLNRWNAEHAGDPNRQIHIKFVTAGAHNQMEMSRLAADGYAGLAEPFSVHTEPYAVTNSAPPTPADHEKLALNPRTGRVNEFNGLFNHDVGQMTNAVYMDKKTVDSMAEVSRFYSEIFDFFKQAGANGKPLRVTNAEAMKLRELFTQYKMADGKSPVDLEQPGLAATRYISVMSMHSQSSYHGYEHMLGWLIRNRYGLEPATFVEGSRGSTFQREAVFHLMRLGIKAPGSEPYFQSPVGVLTYRQATDNQGPLTLERALDFVHNGDRARADHLLRDLQETFKNDPVITARLQEFATRYSSLKNRLTPEQIKALADETRARHQALGLSGVVAENPAQVAVPR